MTVKYCDVCGKVLGKYDRYPSEIFDYDLCEDCKDIERNLKLRVEYLEIMQRRWREIHEGPEGVPV